MASITQKEFGQAAMDGVVAVAGGAVLIELTKGITQIHGFLDGLLPNAPLGISVKAVVAGIVALLAVKYFQK